MGLPGLAGAKGFMGESGAKGPKGSKGPKGETGPDGPKGANGQRVCTCTLPYYYNYYYLLGRYRTNRTSGCTW